MNKPAMKFNFLAQNHCEIQVRTIFVCELYLIKYSKNTLNSGASYFAVPE